jgi:hypothetical protein
MDFFTQLNYKLYNYTPPPVPMYKTYCPPPPPSYYLQKEMIHKTPAPDPVNNSNGTNENREK